MSDKKCKMIVATVCINNESNCLVFNSKDGMNNYLYSQAVRNWPEGTSIPSSRRTVVTEFFGRSGNSLTSRAGTCVPCSVCEEAANKAAGRAGILNRRQQRSGVGSR